MRGLGVSLVLVVLLSVIGAGWALDRLFGYVDTHDNASRLQRQALGAALAESLDDPDSRLPAATNVSMIPADALPLPAPLRRQLEDRQPLTLETVDGITEYHAMPRTGQVLAIDVGPSDASGRPLRILFTVLFYLGIALPILVWLYPLIRRLQRLGKAAQAFGNGELQQRVDTSPRSRLHAIEAEFNQMAARIEGLVADNRLLTSAVSHDLRTPLARLRFGIDAVREEQREAVRHRYLERISDDLTDMENLVSVMLEFARLDQRLQTLPLEPTDLSELVTHAVDVAASSLQDGDTVPASRTHIDWQPGERVPPVLANARYASMMINNLLQNAIRHGHGQVHIATEVRDEHVTLVIEDNGPGIPEGERSDVMKPFVRGAAASNGTTRGYGLGLAIVSRIATWQDTPVAIGQGERLGGARITLAFRRAKRGRSHDSTSASSRSETPVNL